LHHAGGFAGPAAAYKVSLIYVRGVPKGRVPMRAAGARTRFSLSHYCFIPPGKNQLHPRLTR
jgi:hypothetical protein